MASFPFLRPDATKGQRLWLADAEWIRNEAVIRPAGKEGSGNETRQGPLGNKTMAATSQLGAHIDRPQICIQSPSTDTASTSPCPVIHQKYCADKAAKAGFS